MWGCPIIAAQTKFLNNNPVCADAVCFLLKHDKVGGSEDLRVYATLLQGVMDKNMATTIVYWGYLGMMERKWKRLSYSRVIYG